MPFQIVRNDITKMQVDAIVNTANPSPGYGAGIDTAVYEAAGVEELLSKRREIGSVDPGNSFITDGYRLPARFIIHTVGTAWHGGGEGEEAVIRACYKSVFALALENGIESLAIPLLASRSYGFPKGIALRIALSEIESFMSEHDMELYLVVFDEKSFALSLELYGDIDSYISENYVEERALEEYPAEEAAVERGFYGSPPPGTAKKTQSGFEGSFFKRFSESVRSGKKEKAYQAASTADQSILEDSEVSLNLDRSLDDVIGNLDKTFMELVFSFADEKGMTDVEVQKKANLDRKAFSKLKCGTTRNPSKSTALALAVALELNLDDTKDLLSRAGFALSPCSKQDIIVQYFIEREAYDIYEINVALFEHGEQLLGMK